MKPLSYTPSRSLENGVKQPGVSPPANFPTFSAWIEEFVLSPRFEDAIERRLGCAPKLADAARNCFTLFDANFVALLQNLQAGNIIMLEILAQTQLNIKAKVWF